ncbi:uncharacterized protein LOC112692234 [Sipha flava]|uniref:Uncharacterized protein LOC112692234 n=1 Tax=Sipha flava TaxID=143950 RepID=A0A8B8GHZ6_9HEMI|nr:uncharacterized protein LOC112692234 [Sipha flava]
MFRVSCTTDWRYFHFSHFLDDSNRLVPWILVVRRENEICKYCSFYCSTIQMTSQDTAAQKPPVILDLRTSDLSFHARSFSVSYVRLKIKSITCLQRYFTIDNLSSIGKKIMRPIYSMFYFILFVHKTTIGNCQLIIQRQQKF